ncbi:hypothetical protein GGI25_002324 [Coemansia spiralis]|uniref:Calcineurin-like phosphoesterase domain-containing protein n=2 Tax=Coemansia TaxID=4863 RepID=A0A9W8G430_9FUNG|nr:Metallo-dependent phosphatase-like protein [Coemansia spiralis]KAJ1989572.1 hypothetical protein EDC05_004606 [Coemansia umbellata]KAJ2625712.1 hypothetical protein GGI26_000512 [Coemansia sp. RSA 1358]KAJ2678530.1 hypothetical protein GGI25_002324 [Coemansia spiralis]
MERHRIADSLGLVLLTLFCWLYGFHLYNAANQPLAADTRVPAVAGHPQGLSQADHSNNGGVLDDSSDGLLTFIHASDVHISKFYPRGGFVHFLHFLHTAVPLISPRLVTVTGDLTDGKDRQKLISLQQVEEWEAYQRALDSAHVKTRFNGTFYRDQRGNHDCFNVFDFDSPANLYKTYSAMQSDGYSLQIKEPFGTYSFVATDGCPRHGFARPLNFFGYLDAHAMSLLESRIEQARNSNHMFLLNHYPVSTMLYGKHNKSFRELVQSVSVFLCGHLHELAGGAGAQLQTYKARDGYWELEISDLKEHAVYRVYAVDHDLVSFVDITLPLEQVPLYNPELLNVSVTEPIAHPPVVLITNPKDARYLLPKHEPLHIMRSSKFIRALIWADKPIDKVTIKVDGAVHPHPAVYKGKEESPTDPAALAGGRKPEEIVKKPLWVAPWDPASYDDGKPHEIEITATDIAGKTTTSRIPFHFSTNLVPLENDARGGWIMRQNFPDIFRTSGATSYLLATIFLIVLPRLYLVLRLPSNISSWVSKRTVEHHKDEARLRHLRSTLLRGDIINPFVLAKLALGWIAAWTKFIVWTQFTAQVYYASIPWLFWPSYFFAMALATLPLFSGHLIPSAGADGIGSVYAYGIYIGGDWAPLLDSWTYALTSIISLALLLLYLPVAAAPTSIFYSAYSGLRLPWYRRAWMRVCMALFINLYIGIPMVMTVYTYGIMTVVLGYGRAWLFVAAAIALYILDWSYNTPDDNKNHPLSSSSSPSLAPSNNGSSSPRSRIASRRDSEDSDYH